MKIDAQTLLAFPLQFRAFCLAYPKAEETSALRPGEFVLIAPSWYRVREDNGVLTWIGETSFSAEALLNAPTNEQIRQDVEILMDILDSRLSVYDVYCHGVQVTHMRKGFWKPGTDWREGDYIQIDDNLYRVKHTGKLKEIGKNPYFNTTDHSASFEDFAQGFTQVTGLAVSDGMTLMEPGKHVLETEADFDRHFQSLTPEQQRAFMQDCERLFGPPPAVRTHD